MDLNCDTVNDREGIIGPTEVFEAGGGATGPGLDAITEGAWTGWGVVTEGLLLLTVVGGAGEFYERSQKWKERVRFTNWTKFR